ncbi:MAG: anti-sigma factor family protein [Salinarimonas sp.]
MIDTTRNDDVTDDDIQRIIDGTLDPERHAEIVARIAQDPERLERVESMIAHNAALKEAAAALAPYEDDPAETDPRTRELTEALTARLEAGIAARQNWRARLPAYTRNAAAAAILVAAGWFGHLAHDYANAPYPGYVADAAGAHLVFAEDQQYPTEFSAEALNLASGWFAEKLGRDVPPPQLDAVGLKLVGARLLGSKDGPLAQYIYEDDAGERLSLVVKAAATDRPRGPTYRTLPQGRASYWRDGGFEYALISRYADQSLHGSITEVSRALLARRS